MSIRNANIEDKFQIEKLAQKCSPNMRPSTAGTYEYLARCFKKTFFVYEENSKILGYIVGFPNTSKLGEFWLYQVCVSRNHRRKGIGSMLFERIIDEIKLGGYKIIKSHFQFPNQHSRNLHEKFGFKIYDEDDIGWFARLEIK
jgi:GNAT superfamily N-acetyltransferase